MKIVFCGRTYWLLTAEEYQLCANFMDFLELDARIMGIHAKEKISFAKRYNLFYGFADKKGRNMPIPFFFFQYKENWYSVEPTGKTCSKCKVVFDAIHARSRDLYWGSDNVGEAFQWGLTLPYVEKCPHCGFDEHGKGLKYLAIFYNEQIITNL